MDLYFYALVLLALLAVSDLVVGVSNDAANFLNSSIGSRVAPKAVIMAIASLGILLGVTFSGGMMEVARKGIFNPSLFQFHDLMVVFLAVMLADVLLLDLFNTFGLPTSTTVSIVFDLLGASVAVALVKISHTGRPLGELAQYINTGKALVIISGILISVVIAFAMGTLVQFLSRLLFTFNYQANLRRFGALWGGASLAGILYFILIKGAKGASFITPETMVWIKSHTWTLLGATFLVTVVLLQALILFTRVNILKIIILSGTFALAMAFAANDLVNFIGVPLAGKHAYDAAMGASGVPVPDRTMEALQGQVSTETLILLLAGTIMVATLWLSRKSRTVSQTEVNLGRQDEGVERFDATPMSRVMVRMMASLGRLGHRILPAAWYRMVHRRIDQKAALVMRSEQTQTASFDLIRAAVNLGVASALISLGTSLKLPLSTTYVTFMVAMGSSFADKAWGRDTAVYRVTGVLTVIGGWFFTAFMAFSISALYGWLIAEWGTVALICIMMMTVLVVLRNLKIHRNREQIQSETEIFNLRKISDPKASVLATFEHMGIFLSVIEEQLDRAFQGLIQCDRHLLKDVRRHTKRIQGWANIIIANIFKVLRLLHHSERSRSQNYAQIISTLQEIAESHRDLVVRSFTHIDNHHKGFLPVQIEEIRQIHQETLSILHAGAEMLRNHSALTLDPLEGTCRRIGQMLRRFDQNQIVRIQDETSKTRLSILFYSFIWNDQKIARKTLELLRVFQEALNLEDAERRS